MATVMVMVTYRSGMSVLSADRPIAPISPIHKLAGRRRAQVAGLVHRCVEEVERRGAMEQVGIYRLCGSAKRAARLRDQLELHGPLAVDLSPTSVGDVNVITGQPPSRDCSALQIAPQRRFCRATQHAACWRRYAVVCLSVRRDFCAVRIRNSAVTVGRRAFAVHGPMVWNSLPDDLCAQQDYESFRQGLKTWLFSRY